MKQVSWYPGHIDKAVRDLELLIKKVDILVVLLDSRAPFSTYLSFFEKYKERKQILIVLTKSDLSYPLEVQKAQAFFSKTYPTISVNLRASNGKQIDKIFKKLDGMKTKSLIPKAIILGVPNVGKSTIINYLSAKRKAVTEDRAGVTRRVTWFKVNKYYILDTPGVLLPRFDNPNVNFKLAIIGSFKQSILPFDSVGEYLTRYLIQENKIPFTMENYKSEIYNAISETGITEEDYFRIMLRKFQLGEYGNVYLDNFEIDFDKE